MIFLMKAVLNQLNGEKELSNKMRKKYFIFLCFLSFAISFVAAQQTGIQLNLEKKQNVSFAIYDSKGKQIRTLLNAKTLLAGKHTISWDGLDKFGKAVVPGTYFYKTLTSDGIKAEYLFSLGTNNNSTMFWLGNHGGPTAVTVKDGFIYAGAGMTEGPPAFLKMSLDGKVAWVRPRCEAWGGISCMSVADPVKGKDTLGNKCQKASLLLGHPRTGNIYTADIETGKTIHIDHLLGARARGQLAQPLTTSAITIDFVEYKTDNNAQQFTLALYSPEKALGWKSLNGLKAGTEDNDLYEKRKTHTFLSSQRKKRYSIQGKGGKGYHCYCPENELGKGTPSHILYVPAGNLQSAIIEVVLGHPEKELKKVKLFAGYKWGKMHHRKTVSVKAGEILRVELGQVKSKNGEFVLGFGNAKEAPASWAVREIVFKVPYTRMDSGAGRLVMGDPKTETIVELSPTNFKTLSTQKIPGFRDLAVIDANQTYVLTKDSLIRLTGDLHKKVISNLVDAECFTVCPKTKALFIYLGGNKQQIVKYNKDFQPAATFGRLGGRQQGKYLANNFLEIADIAADEQGGFVIVERSAPRRLARFKGDGQLIDEWYGGQAFFAHVAQDPKYKNRFWFESGQWLVETQIDWYKRNWSIFKCLQAA